MTLPVLVVKFHYRPLGNLPYGWIDNVYDLLATEADKSAVGTMNRPLHRLFAHYPSFCQKLATGRIPLKKCEREDFSIGPCRLSCCKTNSIYTKGTCKTSLKKAASGVTAPLP